MHFQQFLVSNLIVDVVMTRMEIEFNFDLQVYQFVRTLRKSIEQSWHKQNLLL